MPQYSISEIALPFYIDVIREKIRAGELVCMKDVAGRFNQKQFMEVTGLSVRRFRRLREDWSAATDDEKMGIRIGLKLTEAELEELI